MEITIMAVTATIILILAGLVLIFGKTGPK